LKIGTLHRLNASSTESVLLIKKFLAKIEILVKDRNIKFKIGKFRQKSISSEKSKIKNDVAFGKIKIYCKHANYLQRLKFFGKNKKFHQK